MGVRASQAWGLCDGHGKGAWGVRAGRAERAGMHRGPLKQSDSHGCQGVEGVGVMGWSGRSGRRGGESGEGGAGGMHWAL